MQQIRYGSSAAPLRFEFPPEWDGKLISALTLTVLNRSGDELMAAAAATLYKATTLDGAVARFAREITLDSGAGALAIGDPILISGVAAEEQHRVEGYDSTNKIAKLERMLEQQYDDGEDVYGLFADYELDVSDTDVFTKGIVLQLVWTPTGDGQVVKQMVQVSGAALDVEGLRREFSDYHPRAHDAFTVPTDKFERVVQMAERRLGNALRLENMDIQRIVDQDDIIDALMAEMVLIWLASGDVDKEDERRQAANEYSRHVEAVKMLPIWTDDDQDDAEDEEEFTSHDHEYEKGW